VEYHDPYVPEVRHDSWRLECVPDLKGALNRADCVVIITPHSSYDWRQVLAESALIVDTRNALGQAGKASPKVVRL
jgi:UDP-N-acetyl-D-glucosamine dehydrogenase